MSYPGHQTIMPSSMREVIFPLCSPLVRPPAQERCGIVGVVPEESHEDDQKAGEASYKVLLQGQVERAGAFQSEKRRLEGIQHPSSTGKLERDFL